MVQLLLLLAIQSIKAGLHEAWELLSNCHQEQFDYRNLPCWHYSQMPFLRRFLSADWASTLPEHAQRLTDGGLILKLMQQGAWIGANLVMAWPAATSHLRGDLYK